MFRLIKFIFKTMSLLTGFIVILSALILWRGGQDFRWAGKKTEQLGRSITDFGEFADKALKLRKKFTDAPKQIHNVTKDIQKQDKKGNQDTGSFQRKVKKEPGSS